MRKIILGIFIILFSLSACAQQYKVAEKSSKRIPEWVHSVTKDYLNVSATGKTIEEAKAAVLASVKQQISESIASRVVSESNLLRTELETDKGAAYVQKMVQNIKSQSAKLPFMGEISLAKASSFYWERRYFKSEKRNEYFYAVQYPFSEFEMKKLVMDFQIHDKQLNDRLSEYEEETDDITSIEDIDKILVDLRAFQSEFIKEDPRFVKIESIMNNYRKMYDAISLSCTKEKEGIIICTLHLSDRQISTSQKPLLKSNCATKLTYSYEGNALLIRYDDFACYPEDENYIEIRFRTGNKYLTKKVYL